MKPYEALTKICRDLQIYEFCVTDTRPFSEIAERLLSFELQGFCEVNVEKRINPKLTLEGANSIVCALFPYIRSDNPHNKKAPFTGKIISGDVNFGCDYHIYVKKKLEAVSAYLKEHFDGRYMCFCDTGPLVDKEIAVRGGLCKYGKNRLAINKRYGSMFFIGYILTDLDIENKSLYSGAYIYDGCLSCNRCIEACPTGALTGLSLNYVKCVSYISQKKGELTKEETAYCNTLYGCHICQNACPANKPGEFARYVSLEHMNISNKEFIRLCGDTAVSWIGKKTFLRNLSIIKNGTVKEL